MEKKQQAAEQQERGTPQLLQRMTWLHWHMAARAFLTNTDCGSARKYTTVVTQAHSLPAVRASRACPDSHAKRNCTRFKSTSSARSSSVHAVVK